jgi:PhnB protein
MGTVNPIPQGYHSITPYLYVEGAAKALDFYGKIFGATERMRMDMPDGTVGHAEIEIGDSVVMLADAPPRATEARGITGSLVLYVEDVDAVFKRAIDAGASQVEPLENKFYGDRMGTLRDPFGFEWSLGTHVEDVSEEEMQRRMAQMGS